MKRRLLTNAKFAAFLGACVGFGCGGPGRDAGPHGASHSGISAPEDLSDTLATGQTVVTGDLATDALSCGDEFCITGDDVELAESEVGDDGEASNARPDGGAESPADSTLADVPVADSGIPPLLESAPKLTCVNLIGQHKLKLILGHGGEGDAVCALNVPGGVRVGGVPSPAISLLSHPCAVGRRWLGDPTTESLLDLPKSKFDICQFSKFTAGHCGMGWSVVVGIATNEMTRILRWSHSASGKAQLQHDVKAENAEALVVLSADKASTQLVALRAKGAETHLAWLLDIDGTGATMSSSMVVLPGLAWYKMPGVVSPKASGGPIATKSGLAGAWVSSMQGNKAYVSLLDGVGILQTRAVNLQPDQWPAALGEAPGILAMSVVQGTAKPTLIVWGAGEAPLWSAPIGNGPIPTICNESSPWHVLRPGPGNAWWLAGNSVYSPDDVALVLGGGSSTVIGSSMSNVSKSGASIGGWHDRLQVVGFDNFAEDTSTLAVTDAYGNIDCATSGPCWQLTATACDDGNACTFDRCDASHDGCWHHQASAGVWCGPLATCAAGVCVAGF